MSTSISNLFDITNIFEPSNYLYFYEERLSENRSNAEVDFLIKALSIEENMEILDLACGHGRHSNRFAELGYKVIGLDYTKGFIEIADRSAKAKGLNVSYIHEDMKELIFRDQFDRVLLIFTAFGYFEDAQNKKILENIHNALRKDGLFCFDILNRDKFLKDMLKYNVIEKNGDLMIDRYSFDCVTGRLYNSRIIIRGGKRIDKPYFVRLYNATEICSLLNEAGFRVEKLYGDYSNVPFDSSSGRMIIVAQKK